MQKDLFGPFSYQKDDLKIRFYLTWTRSKNTIAYIRFGMLVLKVPTRFFNEIMNSNDYETKLIVLISKYRIFDNLCSKCQTMMFRENLTTTYVFIKGIKYEVTDSFNSFDRNKNTFYVSSKNLIQSKFDELALSYFKNRVEELRLIMGIPSSFEVKLCDVTTFKGQNNFVKNVIKLDSHLYSYKENVIDSIIIHELAHFYHHDHSKEFYETVLKYCPNYKRYIKIINEGRFESD